MVESCTRAQQDLIQQEESIDEYLKKLENQIQLQQTQEHVNDLKYIDINKRAEILPFTKATEIEGEEFTWNSYVAKDNHGPAIEFFRDNSIQLEEKPEQKEINKAEENAVIEKRGINLKKTNCPGRIGADKHEAVEENKSSIINVVTKTESVTEFQLLKLTTVTATESFTKFIKTSIITQTDTFEIFDQTVTVTQLSETTKTKTIDKIVTETVAIFIDRDPKIQVKGSVSNETNIMSSLMDITVTPTPISTSTLQQLSEISTATSAGRPRVNKNQDQERLERKKPAARTRNGYYHQKVLAQKNLGLNVKRGLTEDLQTSDGGIIKPPVLIGLNMFSIVAVIVVSTFYFFQPEQLDAEEDANYEVLCSEDEVFEDSTDGIKEDEEIEDSKSWLNGSDKEEISDDTMSELRTYTTLDE